MDVGLLGALAFASLMAGLVQGVTGFGGGIIVMTVLPMMFGVVGGSAVSVASSLALSSSMVWHYRRYVHVREAVLPAFLFMAVNSACILFATTLSPVLMKGMFGIFLLALSAYFLSRGEGSNHPMGKLASVGCVALAGACGGLFGIGGPPMVLYYLARMDDKRAYLGTIQLFFFSTAVWGTLFRIGNGILQLSFLPAIVLAAAMQGAGQAIAHKIVERLDTERIKRLAHIVIGLCGVYYLVQTAVALLA